MADTQTESLEDLLALLGLPEGQPRKAVFTRRYTFDVRVTFDMDTLEGSTAARQAAEGMTAQQDADEGAQWLAGFVAEYLSANHARNVSVSPISATAEEV